MDELRLARARYDLLRHLPVGLYDHSESGLRILVVIQERLKSLHVEITRLEKAAKDASGEGSTQCRGAIAGMMRRLEKSPDLSDG